MSEHLYTMIEAAGLLRVCESTMRTLVRKRKIRFIRLNNAQGSYRFTQAAIDEFLHAGEVRPVGDRVDAVEAARIEREGTEAIVAIQAAIEQAKRLSKNGRAGSLAAAERRAI